MLAYLRQLAIPAFFVLGLTVSGTLAGPDREDGIVKA